MKCNENCENNQIIKNLFKSLYPVQAFSVGLPAISSLLSGFIIGGAYGSVAMASMGFTTTLTIMTSAIGTLLASGSQLLCGQMIGKGDKSGIRRVFNSTIDSSVIIGLIFTVFCLAMAEFTAGLLGASGEAYDGTVSLLRGMSVGFPFIILNACLLPFLQLDCEKKRATISVAVLVFANLGFSLLSVYVLKLGLFGIGLASSLSAVASFAVAAPQFLFKSRIFRIAPSAADGKTMIEVMKMGVPAAINPACCALRARFLNFFLFKLAGTAGVSAQAAALNVQNAISCTVEAGYSGSALLISSVLVGERDSESLRSLHGIAVRSAYYINFITYALIFIFAKPLAVLFGATPEEIPIFCTAIRGVNLWLITSLLKCIPLSIYHSLGKVTMVCITHIINTIIVPLILSLFTSIAGVDILYWCNPVGEAILIIGYIIYYKIQSGRFPKSPFQLVYIPDSFYVTSDNRYSAAVRTLEDVVKVSDGIVKFCRAKGLSERDSMYYGLCVEEMAADTIRHGVANNGKESIIDIRLIYDKGEMSIMIRDNYKEFDPNQWMELYAEDDPSRSIGIKLVTKLAKTMYHTTSLGMNVLFITI